MTKRSEKTELETAPRARASPTAHLPTIAIVGRPNVGKSTLFNRLIGKRRSIVGDEPGITRDRLYGEAHWRGRRIRVIDTGGMLPGDKQSMPAEIFRQAQVALAEADAVIMVADARTEMASPDIQLARLLLRSGKSIFLAVNKIDVPELEPYAQEFRRLGIKQLFAIAAEHGQGVAELLDAVIDTLPEIFIPEITEDATEAETADHKLTETKIAIIGRPNVGKSTLLNKLAGSARAIVSSIPGTTRDAVDEIVRRDGMTYRFIDTAGIRRKGKTHLMAEKLSVVMARKHLEAADIALIIVDATEGVTALDANIAGYAHESGRSLIIVVNKWDLLGPGRPDDKPAADRALYEQKLRDNLKFLAYAPVLFLSATSEQNRNIERLFSTIQEVAQERRKRIPTGEMNRFLKKVDFERAPVPASKRVKIYYMTQAATSPPTFILFTDRPVKLHFSYERFLENQIRREFGFMGTPIWIKNRPRQS